MEPRIYCRKYLRTTPDIPLYGSINITQVGLKHVRTGTAKIRILDISAGGLRFVSSLKFPADCSLIIQIVFTLNQVKFCLDGHIVHVSGTEVCEYEYGLCFTEPDRNLRESVKQLFYTKLSGQNRNMIIFRFL